jgi:hypothetical protein
MRDRHCHEISRSWALSAGRSRLRLRLRDDDLLANRHVVALEVGTTPTLLDGTDRSRSSLAHRYLDPRASKVGEQTESAPAHE